MNVLGPIQRGGLGFDFCLQLFGVLDGVFEIDAAVFVLVYPDGKNIKMGILRLDSGVECNGFQVALDGVAGVKSGDGNLVFAGNRIDFPAVFKAISLGLTGDKRSVCLGFDVDASHIRVDRPAV